MARLDGLQQTTFLRRLRQEAQIDLQDVRSDSGSSAASSFTARKFFEFVCDDCSSLIEGDPDEDAPACSSLNSEGEDEKESVGSIRSVAYS